MSALAALDATASWPYDKVDKVDEIYQFLRHFDRSTCKVLISVDLSDPVTKRAEMWWGKTFGPGSTREDHDYGVSWIKKVGPGRVFYTSFGHDRGAYLDAPRAYHMLLGVQFARGEAEPRASAGVVTVSGGCGLVVLLGIAFRQAMDKQGSCCHLICRLQLR